MSPPAVPEPITPRTFDDLPREIKLGIAGFAQRQDATIRERRATESSTTEWIARIPLGSSLVNLRAVNQELKELCDPMVFATLHASQTLADLFKYTIIFLYGRHFRTLVIRGRQPDNAQDKAEALQAINVLASLPAVQHLDLDMTGLLSIHLSSPSFEQPLFLNPFRSLSHRLERLTLRDTPAFEVALLVPLFPRLKHFRLIGYRLFVDAGVADPLGHRQTVASQLAGLEHLESFAFEYTGTDDHHFGIEDLWKRQWVSFNTLRSLTFTLNIVKVDLLAFIGRRAPTLESLHLDFTMFEEGATSDLTLPSFPKLHTLVLTGNVVDVAYLLSATASAPLHTLALTFLLNSPESIGNVPLPKQAYKKAFDALDPRAGSIVTALRQRFQPVRTLHRLYLAQQPPSELSFELSYSMSHDLARISTEFGGTARRGPFSSTRLPTFGPIDIFAEFDDGSEPDLENFAVR